MLFSLFHPISSVSFNAVLRSRPFCLGQRSVWTGLSNLIITIMAGQVAGQARKNKILNSREVEDLIADGRSVFIYNGKVVKADAWLKYHPGGDKAILHMVGRDATDEVNA